MNRFIAFLLMLFPLCVDTPAFGANEKITVTGTVMCVLQDNGIAEECAGASVQEYVDDKPGNGMVVGEDGKFNLAVTPGSKLKISFVGMEEVWKGVPANDKEKDFGVIGMEIGTTDLADVFFDVCAPATMRTLHAETAVWFENKCVPTECKDGFKLVDTDGKDLTQDAECAGNTPENCNADAKCKKIESSDDNGSTDSQPGQENVDKVQDATRTAVTGAKSVCESDNEDCLNNTNNEECKQEDGECTPAQGEGGAANGDTSAGGATGKSGGDSGGNAGGGDATQTSEDTKAAAERKKEEAKKARIAELEENAKKMKDKEQSMENKLLGAAGMGLTGTGLMQSMSAGAEQKADEAAELDMAAYLATMHCNYAPGKNVKGGEKAVELPGANSLMPLYTEYVALANDLKVRKAALGMQPGIESEAILDGATSGLYDDVALGKTGGAYTSLARALSDPNSEDAKKWAAQKEATAKDKKTGMTLAAVGAIGSAVANIAINSGDDKKEKSDEINAKYDSMEKELNKLERDVNRNAPIVQACPSDTTGPGVPNCVCTDTSKDYKVETNSCQARATDEKVVTPTKTVPVTEKTNDPIKITPVILKGSAVFEIGKDALREDAKTQLTAFVESLKEYKKCSITITGYTDPVGKQENNIQLSKKRADAVKKYMDGVKVDGLDLTIATYAKGEADCYCGLGKDVPDAQRKESDYLACDGKDDNTALTKNERYAPCRRIEMSADCFKESGGGNQGLNLGDIASVVQGVSGGNQLSTAVNTLTPGTDDYKKLVRCKDDGYIKDYLKYIGYELHSVDGSVVEKFEKWCKKENGRLWAKQGHLLPPWAKFPSYFDADGKDTFLVEYQCVIKKQSEMDFDQAMEKYDEMKKILGVNRFADYFTLNCGANDYWERGNSILIEAIKP